MKGETINSKRPPAVNAFSHGFAVRNHDLSRRRSLGVALVITLGFIVLLTGVIVAFFSRSILVRQISNSTAVQVKADLLALGALDTIVADLKQEILVSSSAVPITGGTLYLPKTAADMLPSKPDTSLATNILKISSSKQPFYPGGKSVAIDLPTTAPSVNSRSVSLARWNKPLLVASQKWDCAPDDPASFTAPDWVLMTREGRHPTTLAASNSNANDVQNFVVGRYAYTIYHEGGLLDANVAGYPSSSGTYASYKNALAYADLTQLPTKNGTLAQKYVDKLVAYRNAASARVTLTGGSTFRDATATLSGSSYHNYVASAGNGSGFLTVGASGLSPNGLSSDRPFTSRSSLIQFMLQGLIDPSQATDAEKADMQYALQYLGTFSRDINQPSFEFDPTRPALQSESGGGNDEVQANYNKLNPNFLRLRAPATYSSPEAANKRASDFKAPVKDVEPQVKYRFPLRRLAWLTHRGPIATDAGAYTSDAEITLIVAKLKVEGYTDAYLMQGGPVNIRNSFGLTWDPTNQRWIYRPGKPGPIPTLEETATGSDTHEPNFIELLQSAISTGVLGKAASKLNAVTDEPLHPYTVQHVIDADADRQVMQHAANIIDQFDFDGFSTRIVFDNGSGSARRPMEIRGVENNPYLYRLRTGTLLVRNPIPLHVADGTTATTPSGSNPWDSGVGLIVQLPELWNPHDVNAPLVGGVSAPTDDKLRPSKYRIVGDSTDPQSIPDKMSPDASLAHDPATGDLVDYFKFGARGRSAVGSNASQMSTGGKAPWNFTGSPRNQGNDLGYGIKRRALWSSPTSDTTAATSIMTFDVQGVTTSLFREPTLLTKVGFPAGSNLSGPDFSSDPYFGPSILQNSSGAAFKKDAQGRVGFFCEGSNPLHPLTTNPAQLFTGMVAGFQPVHWVYGSSNRIVAGEWAQLQDLNGRGQDSQATATTIPQMYVTYRVQYLDPKIPDRWVTYDEKYTEVVYDFLGMPVTEKSENPYGGLLQRRENVSWMTGAGNLPYLGVMSWQHWSDPRTSRFGAVTASHQTPIAYPAGTVATEFIDPTNLVLPSTRPDAADDKFAQSSIGRNETPPKSYPFNFHGSYRNSATQAPFVTDPAKAYYGLLAQNSMGNKTYYADADGVVRRAMGGYMTVTSGTNTPGLPTATTQGANARSRPYILNRPFRTVAELGYVFSGTPWRNIDFNTPESGYGALLDVFSVQDTAAAGLQIVAGKVNLNTRQVPVLKAILAGAYKDIANVGGTTITGPEADAIAASAASGIVGRSSIRPFTNISEVVGKWKGGASGAPYDGKLVYEGLSEDLGTAFGANTESSNIQRFRESAIRALGESSSTRVWNLMIDVIAQSGRYPTGTTDSRRFVVEGEQRYWLHVAIDRYTGDVLDKSLEVVKE